MDYLKIIIKLIGVIYITSVIVTFTIAEYVAWTTTDMLMVTFNSVGEKPIEVAWAIVGIPATAYLLASTLKTTFDECMESK